AEEINIDTLAAPKAAPCAVEVEVFVEKASISTVLPPSWMAVLLPTDALVLRLMVACDSAPAPAIAPADTMVRLAVASLSMSFALTVRPPEVTEPFDPIEACVVPPTVGVAK